MKPHRPVILLIEKEEVTLELYQRELDKSFEVLPFTSLEKALEMLENRSIEAIIIEPETGAGEGWKVVQSLDANEVKRSIPIIICSTRDACNSPLSKNVERFVTKPVLPHELRRITENLLAEKEIGAVK